MGGAGVLLVRRSVADVAVHTDQGWTVVGLQEAAVGLGQRIQVVGVGDMFNIPAVSFEPFPHVLGERHIRQAIQGDVVLIVNPAQIGKLQMTGQRGRLAANAFHQVAIAAERVHVVVKDLKTGLVEMRSQPLAGNRHADAISHTLAERAGSSFNACSPTIFGMSGRLAVKLAKMFEVIHRDSQFAEALTFGVHAPHLSQVQHGVQQHRGVAVRKNEAVAIGPDWIRRIVAQELLPKAVGYWRQAHGRPGVSGVRLLYSIDRQGADGIDAQRIQLLAGR